MKKYLLIAFACLFLVGCSRPGRDCFPSVMIQVKDESFRPGCFAPSQYKGFEYLWVNVDGFWFNKGLFHKDEINRMTITFPNGNVCRPENGCKAREE